MKNIVILALGSRGDIYPYATLGEALVKRGYGATFITTRDFAPFIQARGMETVALPADGMETVNAIGTNTIHLMRAFLEISFRILDEWDTFAPWFARAHLLINQLPGGLFGEEIEKTYNIPCLQAAVIPLTPTDTMPMMGFPNLYWIPGANRATYQFSAFVGWAMIRHRVNQWRTSALQLPAAPLTGYAQKQFPILYGISPHLFPPPLDWPTNTHVTGYWYPHDKKWEPTNRLQHFLNKGEPPIFIGFGSMPVQNRVATEQKVIDALTKVGMRGVIQTWGSFPLPEHVYQLEYAPYGWLLPRMAGLIHHGGAGTTAFGAASGIPSMTVPFLFDQKFWGNRLAALGVGPRPIPFHQLTENKLAQAIHTMKNNRQMRTKAAELGHKVRMESGTKTAVGLVESFLA